MSKILKKCGYYVGDEHGKSNYLLNVVDANLSIAYVVLAFINSRGSAPSILLFCINIILFGRLVIQNLIEQKRVTENIKNTEDKYVATGVTLIHLIKIIIEIVVPIFVIALSIYLKVKDDGFNYVVLINSCVLFFTLMENLLCVTERLHKAEVLPLVLYNSKSKEDGE